VRKWSKGVKIALLISLSIHITAFLVFRGTTLYSSILNVIPKGLRVDIINVPKDSSLLPSMFNKKIEMTERTQTPTKRTTRLSPDISSMKISSSELPRRQIVTKIDSVTHVNTLSLNPEISSQNLPSNSLPVTSLTGSAQDTFSQGKNVGRIVGSNSSGKSREIADSGKIIPTTQPKTPVADLSLSKKLQIYKDSDMPFVNALDKIGIHISQFKSKKVDVTFIIDISESMQNDIDSIRQHLNILIEQFGEAGLDYTVGVVTFHYNAMLNWLGTDIEITDQTRDIELIRDVLRNIKVGGDERPLDALIKAFSKVRFRSGAGRHFILVTDEYVKVTRNISDILREAKRMKVVVDVIGMDEPFQRSIAEQTGGIWMPIETAMQK
jgi:Mg-chelatase subunit ChlD